MKAFSRPILVRATESQRFRKRTSRESQNCGGALREVPWGSYSTVVTTGAKTSTDNLLAGIPPDSFV